jgi:hypothetical protein
MESQKSDEESQKSRNDCVCDRLIRHRLRRNREHAWRWVDICFGDQQSFLDLLPTATIINGFVALVLSVVQARGHASKAIALFVMYLTAASMLCRFTCPSHIG